MILRLLRVRQWYKNLLVFLPLFFAGRLAEPSSVVLTIVGFFALSLVSSAGYVLNDILDMKRDREHPEKKNRPLASGKIRVWQAFLLMMTLLLSGLGLAASLSNTFYLFASGLFAIMMLYNFWGRNEMFADVLLISVNYIVRAVSGSFIASDGFVPYIYVSPWLILCPFFLALFLASAKRRADLLYLGKDNNHRKVLQNYSGNISHSLMVISTTLLVLSYGFYTFFSEHQALLFTLPFALYTIFRYYALVEKGSVIGRHPEAAYRDMRLVLSALLWLGVTAVILYI